MVFCTHLQEMHKSNAITPLVYRLPFSNQQVVLMPAALNTFSSYRQTGEASEAGGLLFATFDLPFIRIAEVSEPHILDGRHRYRFFPNRLLQRRLIRKKFKQGLHYIGEWHTHPEPAPHPSYLDLESMAEAFVKSRHRLNWFIMIIVGNKEESLKLWVGAHNSFTYYKLRRT